MNKDKRMTWLLLYFAKSLQWNYNFQICSTVAPDSRASSQNPRQWNCNFKVELQFHIVYPTVVPSHISSSLSQTLLCRIQILLSLSLLRFYKFHKTLVVFQQIYKPNLQVQTWKGFLLVWVQEQPPKTSSPSVDQPLSLASSSVCFRSLFPFPLMGIVDFQEPLTDLYISLFKTHFRLFCQQVNTIEFLVIFFKLNLRLNRSDLGTGILDLRFIDFAQKIRDFPPQIEVVFPLLFVRVLNEDRCVSKRLRNGIFDLWYCYLSMYRQILSHLLPQLPFLITRLKPYLFF